MAERASVAEWRGFPSRSYPPTGPGSAGRVGAIEATRPVPPPVAAPPGPGILNEEGETGPRAVGRPGHGLSAAEGEMRRFVVRHYPQIDWTVRFLGAMAIGSLLSVYAMSAGFDGLTVLIVGWSVVTLMASLSLCLRLVAMQA
jgi:hypothetical protein